MAQAAIRLIHSIDNDQSSSRPSFTDESREERREREARHGRAYFGREGAIRELLIMAEITSQMIDRLFSAPHPVENATYLVPDFDRQHAEFAIGHLITMIQEEQRAFDETFGEQQ